MLDLESEIMRGPDSIPTGGNILSLDFFCIHPVKTKIPILAFSSSLWKTRYSPLAAITISQLPSHPVNRYLNIQHWLQLLAGFTKLRTTRTSSNGSTTPCWLYLWAKWNCLTVSLLPHNSQTYERFFSCGGRPILKQRTRSHLFPEYFKVYAHSLWLRIFHEEITYILAMTYLSSNFRHWAQTFLIKLRLDSPQYLLK